MNKAIHFQVLQTLADYRILSSSQITQLLFKSSQMARRTLRELELIHWITPQKLASYSKKGRPEKAYTPSEKGLNHLNAIEGLPPSPTPSQIPHQLAVNQLRILALDLEKHKSQIQVTTLAPNSLLKRPHKGFLTVTSNTRLVPDTILCLEHPPEKKKLLFFIEMDMGTESQQSQKGHTNNLQHKIISYAKCMAEGKYHFLNKVFNAQFTGFRVLLVANSSSRLEQINRLTGSIPYNHFIWTTHIENLKSQGMAAHIWHSNGTPPLQSILGKLATKP